jgi:hypothetical protein
MAYVAEYEHDVFISYAHVDNEPLVGVTEGWVTTLVRNLETVLRQKLGDREHRLSIWMDHELAGNRPFGDDIVAALERTATLLVIASPGYITSEWVLARARDLPPPGRLARAQWLAGLHRPSRSPRVDSSAARIRRPARLPLLDRGGSGTHATHPGRAGADRR